jgi:hypothetical protein
MKTFDSFDEAWQTYNPSLNTAGFDPWTIAKFTHTDDQTYQYLRAMQEDTLGFQPTLLTLADPLSQKSEEMVIRNLTTEMLSGIQYQYRQRFISQLPHRFGLFHSDKTQADAVYEHWEAFAQQWLERDGQDVMLYNLPLLFDHVSDVVYWSWQQKGFDPCGTQRLIVTVFQYRTGRFAEVFITNITDAEMQRIKLLMQSRLALRSEELF